MKDLFFISIVSFLLCFNAYGQSISSETLKYAEKVTQAFAEDYPGMSITLFKENKKVFQKSYGYSDLDKMRSVEDNTLFMIYSTSKFITGLAFLKLVHEEKIENLDIPIHDIDPTLPKHYKGITLRHLLTHRSGIRHYHGRRDWKKFASLKVNSPHEAMDFFINDALKFQPGEKEKYTTFGIVVASHLLEQITGMKYTDALNKLLPFSTPIILDQAHERKSIPYIKKGKKYKVIEGMGAASKYGGGGLITTSQQLAEAGKMLYDNSIAPLAKIKELYKKEHPKGLNYGTAYAMGSGFSKNYGDETVLYANMGGGSPGGRSYILVLADLKVSVALTANIEGDGDKAYELCIDLAKRFAGIN